MDKAPVAKVPVRRSCNIVLEIDNLPFNVYSKKICSALLLYLLCVHNFLWVFLDFSSLYYFLFVTKQMSPSLTLHCFRFMVISWCLNISEQRLPLVYIFPAFPSSMILVCHVLKFYNTYPDYLEHHLNGDRNTQLFCPVHNIILDWLR